MSITVSKKRVREPQKTKPGSRSSGLYQFLYWLRSTVFLLLLAIVLWSSSTTIISGSFVHLCVSSRKLNNLYCFSAGAQPNFDVPIPVLSDNNTGTSPGPVTIPTIVSLKTTELTVPVLSYNSPETSPSSTPVYVPVTVPNIVTLIKTEPDLKMPVLILHDNNTGSGSILHPIPVPVPKSDDEIVNALKVVKEQIQVHRSWISTTNNQACNGRGIYVYDLPPKFNKELINQCDNMVAWINFCDYFTNGAMGTEIPKLGKGWYQTHQYSLEPIFHSRVLKHHCRVYNENEAKLFYVPYYGGLDILRWHFKNVSANVKDALGFELVKWLENRQAWTRSRGKDHVFVLGKISWDFRRNQITKWGTSFLELDQMQKPLKLLIERHPWHINDIGVPHPTHFHPRTDEDIMEWQTKIIGSSRKSLISFAGAARPGAPDNIRSILIKQCTSRNDGNCRFLNCISHGCNDPETVIKLFMESEFCLQPPGDSPTRKSVFDSLISGCIPVLFDPFTAYYQYPWHLPEDHERYSVFIDKEDVREMKVDVVEKLMKVSMKERDDMRRYIAYELLPGLVYGDPNSEFHKFQDAFSISMNNLLDRVTRLESNA
ncbi:hypothetical protein GIB67_008360 [Kingdonia uniflora]|uniref:Exostosin GT47 domain-containing protein n=1 Tax=Kingdonia uniflora TaxID=39325 RepID=A0A7J7N4W1_9MAGN|nr:hypothetical protein GIB67_008360 [Kingdonia uniflora]